MAKARRQHLHYVIDGKNLDTTHVTEHRGSPHTLVCTKTKGSFERALQAHRVDLDQLAKVRKLQASVEGQLAHLEGHRGVALKTTRRR